MKKEELQKKLGEVEGRVTRLVSQDESIRREFAKAFRWGRPKRQEIGYTMSGTKLEDWDWNVPTWEQIFVEIGKLKSLLDYRDFDGNLSELEHRFNSLEKFIRSDVHPNLPEL